jgi:hypothetical protein
VGLHDSGCVRATAVPEARWRSDMDAYGTLAGDPK